MIFAHSNPTCSINIKKELYPRTIKKVRILRGSWIPPGCIILPGVNIGPDSIVGAGSVIIKDVEKDSLYAGSPAKKIKDLEFKAKL
jgi:acetyltransferase-like isoleucine patch superfamily enzyme